MKDKSQPASTVTGVYSEGDAWYYQITFSRRDGWSRFGQGPYATQGAAQEAFEADPLIKLKTYVQRICFELVILAVGTASLANVNYPTLRDADWKMPVYLIIGVILVYASIVSIKQVLEEVGMQLVLRGYATRKDDV